MFDGFNPFQAVMQGGFKIADYMHDEEMQEDAQQENATQNWLTRQHNSAEALANRVWQEKMSSTAWQRGVTDMRAAGINPMLAASRGGASTPSGSAGLSSGGGAGGGTATASGRAGLSDSVFMNSAIVARTDAETQKILAEKKEVEARTHTYPVTIEQMRTNIEKMIAETSATRQGEATSAATEANLRQDTINKRELVEQIRMQVSQLRQLTMLTGSQDAEVRQRVNANLPRLEGILMDLDRSVREMELPGHRNREAAADSFIGQLKEYLKGLNPLGGIVGALPTPARSVNHLHRRVP